MHLYSLCSSSKTGSSYLVRGSRTSLLIDCGSTNRHLKLATSMLGLSMNDITACVLTHSHPDHTCSVRFLERNGVAVYAREETCEALVRAGRSRGDVRPARTRSESIGEFLVRWFPVPHYSQDEGSCMLISSPAGSVAVVTDAGVVPEGVRESLRGASCIICESNHDEAHARSGVPYEGGRWRPLWILWHHSLGPKGHLSNDQAGGTLAGLVTEETHTVLLCHISEDYNRPDVASDAVSRRLAETGWGGTILVAPADRVLGPVGPVRHAG